MVTINTESDGISFLTGDVWLPPEPDEQWLENFNKKYKSAGDKILYISDIATKIETLHEHYRMAMGVVFHKMMKNSKGKPVVVRVDDCIVYLHKNKHNLTVKLFPPDKTSSKKDSLWRVTILYGSANHDYYTWIRANTKKKAARLALNRFNKRKTRDDAKKITTQEYIVKGRLK